jgi:hypothetical protein
LSLVGAGVAVIGTVGSLALLGWLAGATLTSAGYPAIPEAAPAWTVGALIIVFASLALGFLLFGAASLRSDALPQSVGSLLVIPGLAWLGLIASNLVLPSGQ